jgi:hypothetical protein
VIRNLKHLYSPVLLENDVFSLSLSAKYKTEELESFHTIDEAFIVLAPYMNNPFLTALYSRRKTTYLQTQQKSRNYYHASYI